MSSVALAVWIGFGVPVSLYLAKRWIDYLWPIDRHWPLFDKYSRPNKEDTPDEE